MDKRIKQKIENGAAADYAIARAAGKVWELVDCKKMLVSMYGADAEQVAHDYFVRFFSLRETIARSPAWQRDMVDSLREYWARDSYEVPADVQSQFAPAINDRSNKD